VPDPQDPETFRSSRLDWDEAATGAHAVLLQAYRDLAALRRAEADLTDPDMRRTSCTVDEEDRWVRMDRGSLVVLAAFGGEATVPLPEGTYEVVWSTPTPVALGLGEVRAPRHTGAVLRRL
jgi:maltooligosyltrehalose trehalohydrolase